MRKKQILFFAKCPMNYVLFQPIHERLAAHAGLDFVFTGKYQGSKDPRRVYASFDLMGGRLQHNGIARWRRYDVYLSPDFRIAGRRARLKVHMFHGFSIRNFAIQERAKRFDRLFMIGPYMRRRFIESGILAPDDHRIEEIGMPKLDRLVNGAYDRDEVLLKLGLDPALKTVLFAPTWIAGGCLQRMGREIVRELGRLPINTIIKLHDNSYDLRKQDVDWGAVLPPILSERQVLARGVDSNPYLAASDLLISDASSIANEFLLLDRPLVFFRLDHLEQEWPSTDRSTWGTDTGVVIDHPSELEPVLFKSLQQPETRSEIRRAAAADFFYAPGSATDRAATKLLEYAEIDEALGR